MAVVTSRNRRLDVARGALIVLVVLGHYLETTGHTPAQDGLFPGWWQAPQQHVLTAIYLFHMPAFVLLAGVTARADGTLRRVAGLLLLFLVLDAGYELANLVLGSPVPTTAGIPFFALWFLVALAWWQLSMPLVSRWPRTTLALSVVVAALAGAIDVDPAIASWGRAVYFWPFFVLGHLLGTRVLPARVPAAWRAVAVGAGTLLLTLYVVVDTDPSWSRGTSAFDVLGVTVVHGAALRFATLAAGLVMIAALVVAIPGRLGWLETIGRHSLAVYSWHIAGVVALQLLFTRALTDASNPAMLAIALASVVLAVAVFSRAPFERAVRAVLALPLRR